jgi:excisionase family DNA binding protein
MVRSLYDRSDNEIVDKLTEAGLRTGHGRAFDVAAVRWTRYAHGIPPAPSVFRADELTVAQVAARLGIGERTVYDWIGHARLDARRDGKRVCVPFPAEVEEACREMVACSTKIKPRTPKLAEGGRV